MNPVGDGSTTEVAEEASFADAIQVEGESSAHPDTSATKQQALDSNAIQRSMLDFVAREVPENKFCLALVQSVSLWFDQLSKQLLIAAFYTSLAAGKGAEDQNSVRLLCDMLSQKLPTLQISSSDQANTNNIKDDQEDEEHALSTTTEHEDIELLKRAKEWLNSQVLGALSWLEEHLYNFKGLHDHAVKNPVTFYKAAVHLEPFNNLPEPFSQFTPFLRLLLGVTLQPNATHAALKWYNFTSMQQLWPSGPPQATTPQRDSGARMTVALQIAPSHCCPVLLHCNVPHAVVSTLHVLLSIYRCGMALLHAPTSRSLQLLASSTKYTPRRAQTSLKVIHASEHLQSAAVLETVSTAATDGNWVLIACAHLRPDLIPAIVRLAVMLQDNTSTSAYFKIFFSCPSEYLTTIPLRSSIMCMMCGPEQRTCEAVSLLRAADCPLADRIPLIRAPQDLESDLSAARNETVQGTGGVAAHATPPSTSTGSMLSSALSPVQLQLLQTLAVRVAIAVAQVESQIRSSSAHASFLCTLVPTVTARDFVHVLWLIYEHVRLAPDSRSLRMGELRSAIAQVAFEQRHGPTAHRSAALTILQQHLPAGSASLSHTGLPANTFSELFNKATVQLSKIQFAQTESDMPTFHAWKSQQVLSFFMRSQKQQVPGSISLRVIPPPWMAVSVHCAHLQRELQKLQASIQAAWTHVQSHILDLCGTGESGEPASKTAEKLPNPSSINPDGQSDERSEDDEEPPSLMTRLPCRSEIDAILKEQGVCLAASEPPQADRPIASEASQAAVTRLPIVNRPRLSTTGASRSHRAVSLGPKTSNRGSRARTGGHNSIVSQHPASRAAQQSATQSSMRPFGSQHGTKSIVSKSFGGNNNGIPSRFSSRPGSRHASHTAADTYNQPQMGVERSCSPSEQPNSNLGGADDPEKGSFVSPNAARSPSCGIQFHSQVHRTSGSRSISPQRSTKAASGTTITLTFAQDAVSQSSATGSEEGSQAGASPNKQSDTPNTAAEVAVGGTPGVVAPQRTPSRKSVKYHADSMVLGAKTMARRNSLCHLMLSQRIQMEKRCRLFPFECISLALARLGEVVCRASQCIAILKTCADYGTDLPVPLRTLLESLLHSTGPLEWNLDSLQHSSQPRVARQPNSLFWRPYMLKSEMDSWLGGVQKQLYVLQCMAAALRTFQSKESSEAANAEASTSADRPPLPFSAVARPRAVVATAKRLLSQAQNIPLQNITCNAVLTTAAAHKAAAAANSSCKHAAVFSISPTAWQDVDESTPAQLRIDDETFWCPRDWGPLTGDTPVLVVNPVRSIKGSCTATSVSRKVDQDQEFSQAVDQLMVHKNGSFLRLMEFDDAASGGAKKRTRYASWAGLLSG